MAKDGDKLVVELRKEIYFFHRLGTIDYKISLEAGILEVWLNSRIN